MDKAWFSYLIVSISVQSYGEPCRHINAPSAPPVPSADPGITDYDDTDYGPNADGVTDYEDTDYGPYSDGVTDYEPPDDGPYVDGDTDYEDRDDGDDRDDDDDDWDD